MKKFFYLKCTLPVFLMLLSVVAFGQSGSVTGKVVDEKNLPLPGASVSILGTTLSTSTDLDGNYRLSGVPTGSQTIVFRFIGYNEITKAITVTASTAVNVALTPSSQALNEVVVVGYGTQRKSDLTGSISTVSTKDFQKGVMATPEQLISGKVAGVSITSNSGQPGNGSTIRIRGGASLNASNNPLIVVDGVPLSDNAINGAPNALSLINPSDIETFTVLKDASAAAIYGSRASNGVILITTKKGSSGKPSISFSSQFAGATVNNTVDVLSANEYREFVNANGTPAQIAQLGTANTDWQKEIFQTAISTDNNLSVSGSVKKLPYRISLGYLDQEGILKTGKLQRTSGSLNLSPSFFKDHLKVDVNVKGALNENRFANSGAIGAAISMNPTLPVYSENERFGGYYEWMSGDNLLTLAPRNPVGLLNLREDRSTVKRSIGNAKLDYSFHFLPELHANLNVGYDVSKGEGTIFVPEIAAQEFQRFTDAQGVHHSGRNNRYEQTLTNKLLEFYLNYGKDLRSIDSRIDLVAGYGYQNFTNEDLPNGGANYGYPDMTADNVVVQSRIYPFDMFENTLISYYGRLNYSFKNRYMLTATVRTDGSSRFSPENRWATFPSAALAWNIKEESFLKDAKALSALKFRVGYGITGQQEGIGLYDYVSYYNLSTNTAQYQLGDTFYNMYRPGGYYYNRKWEQTATSNIAVDYGFLDNRITGTLEYYFKETKDLLNEVGQPAGTNFANRIVANIGSMENRGVEFTLNTQPIRKEDMSLDFGFNVTYNQNKITNLTIAPDPNYPGARFGNISGGTGNTVLIHSVGKPRGSFFVYEQVYGENNKPLDGVFVDRNGDGTINESDLYTYKSIDPKVFFGVNSSFNYKKWNAGFVLRGNLGNYIYNNVFSSTGVTRNIFNPLGYLNNGSRNVLETNFSGNGNAYYSSDYYVQNASFLKMDNINVGYNVGSLFNAKANLRINANVQNAFVITKYEGIDPEINGGLDNNFYPRPRTFVLGLNLDF